ncbi:MAG: efflux transporter outer membrane subunit [Candidatus Binatia bacterium]
MRRTIFALTVVSLALSSCSMIPSYERPTVPMPQDWSVAEPAPQSQPDEAPFWQALGSEDLNGLMKVALTQNLDLQAALHRVEQARAQTKVAGAALWPSLNAGGGLSRNSDESSVESPWRGVTTLSYELDLWGKNRSQATAANYRVAASQYDREALWLVVAADTAAFYTRVLGFNERIRIAETNLKNAEEILRIIEARFRAGSVSALEVSQQRLAVNDIRAALTALREQRATTLNALAILLGQAPQNLNAPKTVLASVAMPEVSLTPPASLLTARPDIQSAEAGLLAANADIGVARAAFFPSLQLGVDSSIAAAGLAHPANAALSLASNVLAPIFSGGRLTGNLESVTARQRELAAQYQKTVLTAFREVEDALAALQGSGEQEVLAGESVKEAQNAYTIAKARFDAGAIDYLTLLEAQRSLSQAEDGEIVATVAELEAFIQLRKALGW